MNADSLPPISTSEERLHWFQSERRSYGVVKHGSRFSTQGLLLLTDIEKSFCAGAWLSVVVLAYAIIDATYREVSGDYKASAQDLYASDSDLASLRDLRNQVVHVLPPGSASSLWRASANDLAACHAALESQARHAVELVFRHVFARAVA